MSHHLNNALALSWFCARRFMQHRAQSSHFVQATCVLSGSRHGTAQLPAFNHTGYQGQTSGCKPNDRTGCLSTIAWQRRSFFTLVISSQNTLFLGKADKRSINVYRLVFIGTRHNNQITPANILLLFAHRAFS